MGKLRVFSLACEVLFIINIFFFLLSLVDDVQLTANCDEGLDGPVDVVKRMGRRDLHANSCFSFRHDRVAKSNHVDASTYHQYNLLMDYFYS